MSGPSLPGQSHLPLPSSTHPDSCQQPGSPQPTRPSGHLVGLCVPVKAGLPSLGLSGRAGSHQN